MMIKPATLTEMLERNRNAQRSITYLQGEVEERSVSHAEIYERALGILYHLQKMGAKRGDELILFLNDNEQFVDAFWAAVLGGIIPVPVAVGINNEHRHKLLRIARTLGNPFLYTARRHLDRIGAFADHAGEGEVFGRLRARAFLVDNLDDISQPGRPHRAKPTDIAFIQFSSGSTSDPKGVVLTHRNIIANWLGLTEAARFSEEDVSLSWMPLTHDMGLIGFHIVMFANRVHCHLMPTELFIRRPLLWLQLASRKHATILCSPNFGYRHYLKVLGDRPVGELDLSAVRLIFNGAEPISVELSNEFLMRLGPAKLKRNAMFPVYGLAEASLAVSFPEVNAPLQIVSLHRRHMGVGDRVVPVAASDKDALSLVGVGKAIPYCRFRITDDEDRKLPDGRIGHIHISGDNVTRGYHGNSLANSEAMTADGWVRTGDLGLMYGGQLYITGRAKEIIFVNGQNYYPHDLESIAQPADGLELGKVVAAGVRPPGEQVERLIVFVLHRGDMKEFLPVATQVARLINEQTGLEVAEVVPVKRIPKTTSGKVQRHLMERGYVDGEFDAELTELRLLREAQRGFSSAASRSAIENQLRSICETALDGKRLDVDENFFEIGASSLKLIEIHQNIDREYPGQVELTELVDYPTIQQLAAHLETRLTAKG